MVFAFAAIEIIVFPQKLTDLNLLLYADVDIQWRDRSTKGSETKTNINHIGIRYTTKRTSTFTAKRAANYHFQFMRYLVRHICTPFPV